MPARLASCTPWVGDYCTYAPRAPAVCVVHLPRAQGSLPGMEGCCTYGPRVPASGVCTAQLLMPWHPRSEPPSRPPFDPWEEQQGQSVPVGSGPARLPRCAWQLRVERHSKGEPRPLAPCHGLGCARARVRSAAAQPPLAPRMAVHPAGGGGQEGERDRHGAAAPQGRSRRRRVLRGQLARPRRLRTAGQGPDGGPSQRGRRYADARSCPDRTQIVPDRARSHTRSYEIIRDHTPDHVPPHLPLTPLALTLASRVGSARDARVRQGYAVRAGRRLQPGSGRLRSNRNRDPNRGSGP